MFFGRKSPRKPHSRDPWVDCTEIWKGYLRKLFLIHYTEQRRCGLQRKLKLKSLRKTDLTASLERGLPCHPQIRKRC
ncbi:Plexin Domain-Containing Protein 1 [Manis pentadactyla]|nr:Plexin Domain-Containing Protein 1 [Manis pentadactyla]